LKILIDTHIFLWAITGDPRLSALQRSVYTDESNDIYLSVASVWEILIKSGLRKLPLPVPAAAWLSRQLEENRITALAIRMSHLTELECLPSLHRDPFDRMLVAQARAEKMPILSADPEIRKYDVALV
jgi:PIN domain nuclease of toxin-antitoxin system